jgi:DNA-binding transcriptional MerR regulator
VRQNFAREVTLSGYGFNFETLYHLELTTLYDIVHIIRGGDAAIAPDHDVIIRGCIIPFLRDATKVPKSASKDEIMRLALIATAKQVGVSFEDWDSAHTDNIASATRRQIQTLVAKRLDELDPKKREKLLGSARNNLQESAKTMGVPLAGAGAIIAGELSGFGIYLATITGLHALSLALGTTFSWGVYQGATTLLGIILGPIGWAIAGAGVAGGAVMAIRNWAKGKGERNLMLTVVALLFAIGESPFDFFGLIPGVSLDEVKKVYRAMMKTFHPDKLERNLPQWICDDFNEKLLRCQEAYEKLQRVLGQGEKGDKEDE